MEMQQYCINDKITVLKGTVGQGKRVFGGTMTDEMKHTLAIDFCLEGSCELQIPNGELILMKPGRCSIGMGEDIPNLLFYPLERYEGLKLLFQEGALDEPAFSLLSEFGISHKGLLDEVRGDPLIWHCNQEAKRLFEEICDLLEPVNTPMIKLKLLELLVCLGQNATQQNNVTYLPRSQVEIAKAIHKTLTDHPSAEYDLSKTAKDYGVSVSSLNRYFDAVYGETIPKWMRAYRMRLSASLLEESFQSVGDIAAAVGYTNASKFSAAFKREYGLTPVEYRATHKRTV